MCFLMLRLSLEGQTSVACAISLAQGQNKKASRNAQWLIKPLPSAQSTLTYVGSTHKPLAKILHMDNIQSNHESPVLQKNTDSHVALQAGKGRCGRKEAGSE